MSTYAFVLLASWYSVISYEDLVLVRHSLYIIMVCIIIVVLAFSLRRIRNYTRLLKANKVFANEWLMIAHLFCFCATFVFYINYVIIYVRLMDTDYILYDER